jgi:hypothetical protein
VRSIRKPARVGAPVAAAAVVAAAAAWPHGRPAAPPLAAPPGTLAGAPLQRASCRHWEAADGAQRTVAVRALTATIGGPSTSGGVGTTLSDAAAAALFDRVCATPGTAGFALYLVYARAAAFSHRAVGPPGTRY